MSENAGDPTKITKSSKLAQIDNPSHRLVEYFVIVSSVEQNDTTHNSTKNNSEEFGDWKTESYDDDDEKNIFKEYKFKPQITARYPLQDHADNPLHENVTFFCHPTGGIHLRTDGFLPKVSL